MKTMIEFDVQIMGQEVETKEFSNEIGSIIQQLGLKKGDTLRLHPFNTFSKETTSYVEEYQYYHNKLLLIDAYEVDICSSWNDSQKAIIYINLVLTDNN